MLRRPGQPAHQLRHLGRLDQPFHRAFGQDHGLQHLVFRDAVHPGLVGYLLLHQRRAHVPRADAVAGHPVRCALQRDHLGQPLQAVLGGDVGRLVRRGPQPVHRADVDDPAEALVVHVRQRCPGEQERRLEHQPQDAPEHLRRELLNRRHMLDASVVDQHVDVEPQSLQPGHVGQVDRPRLAAGAGRDPVRARLVQVGRDDISTSRGQRRGAGRANPAGRAGDQRPPPGEAGCVVHREAPRSGSLTHCPTGR